MRTFKRLHSVLLFLGLLSAIPVIPAIPATSAIAAPSGSTPITISLPAATVHSSLQQMLPLDIPSRSKQLQGDLTLHTLDRLEIKDNVITVQGLLSGKNLLVNTRLVGQDIQLRLGEVRLPVLCNLQVQLDQARRKLLVTPRFADTTVQSAAAAGQDALAPLLDALAGHQYQIDLDALGDIELKNGTRIIPVTLEPVGMTTTNNALTLFLLPKVGASQRAD
ncbi:MAG: hypothetical protein ACOX5Z_06540 [Desulfobulbus sp.]|jgi:hypothetical protein